MITKKNIGKIVAVFCIFALTSCSKAATSAETINMSLAYAATAVISLLLVICYCAFVRKKDFWMLLLFASVFIVNSGYFALSISKTLGEALLANRISYLGAVFLPLCMLVCIMDICKVNYRKWFLAALTSVSFLVFLLAASPGYLTLYYKDVSLEFVDGMAKLHKVYGPLHFVYMVYLLAFFAFMIISVGISLKAKKPAAINHSPIILTIVFLNICIWYVEQHVYVDFEFLAISYIISELLLLMLHEVIYSHERMLVDTAASQPVSQPEELSPEQEVEYIIQNWRSVSLLTARETDVLKALRLDKKRKDIAAELHVTEHTVKKHTANIFSKLEVSNRSELLDKAKRETSK